MKLFPRKKKLKGMTLVEIIISLFIFTLMALMMVRIASVSTKLTKNANHVNKKVTVQAPLAEIQNTDGTLTQMIDDNMKIEVEIGGHKVNVVGQQYSTKQAVIGNNYAHYEDASNANNPNNDANIHLEFVKIDLTKNSGDNLWEEPTTEPTT